MVMLSRVKQFTLKTLGEDFITGRVCRQRGHSAARIDFITEHRKNWVAEASIGSILRAGFCLVETAEARFIMLQT
jgi:hypothetical protein